MTLKTVTTLFFVVSLFSCSAHAGPRENHYKPHHGAYHHKHQRHHYHKHKHKKHHRHYKAHYQGVAHAPVYVVPGLELGLRYGFKAGEAVIIYRSPHDY